MSEQHCIVCGRPVDGWYEWRWHSVHDGPICQHCWSEQPGVIPDRSPDAPGGVEYSEEAQPGFQIMRRRMIENWRK